MTEKLVPQLRFPGYTDAWEQRKLGEVVNQVVREIDKPDNSYYRISVRSHAKGTFHQLVEDPKTVSMDKLYIVKEGDLIVNITFAWEHAIAVANSKDDGLYVSHRFPTYRAVEDADIDFIKYLVSQEEFRRKLEFISPGGAGRNRVLNKKDFLKLTVILPTHPEQARIGNFFRQLDDLLTLHQRKLEETKALKKSLLQKMFPKNGEVIPEVRFPEYTDAWEQRKVGEFLSESKILGSNGEVAKKLTVKLWSKGVVPKQEIYNGSSATQYYIRRAGQFMYGKLDFLNQAFGIVPEELDGYESTLDSPAFDFLDGLDDKFFLEFVSRKEFYEYQGMIANGSRKAKRIHVDTFFDMPLVLPTHPEQGRIGNFFRQLDDLLTLHQRKLEHLKQLKKALLQQLFI